MTRERPILFSAPMVRAILNGHKTQTRRVIKGGRPSESPGDHPPLQVGGKGAWRWPGPSDASDGLRFRCPYGHPGDRLWVRERVTLVRGHGERPDLYGPAEATIRYEADDATARLVVPDDDRTFPWKRYTRPSIHMPRWASRITLDVTSVRAERLQSISPLDATAEGSWTRVLAECAEKAWAFDPVTNGEPVQAFRAAWDTINGERGYGWDKNPWVWVVEFRVLTPTPEVGA